mmetsp:Transcript_36863/g.94258  ORF Transcript_36863/g.94258 Transcript_36863/m.94258 type:complete len:116 (-) Transcript_36863:383-730(-)
MGRIEIAAPVVCPPLKAEFLIQESGSVSASCWGIRTPSFRLVWCRHRRDECHEYIRRHGGAVAKSVTGRVTHILNDHGEVGPSKRRKAEAAGIPIVGEDALLALVSAAPKGPGSS